MNDSCEKMSSSTRSLPCTRVVSPQDPSSISRFVDVINAAFATTALSTTFISEIDNTPPPYPSLSLHQERRRRHFVSGIQDAARDGAILLEAGNWSAVALWEPPTFKGKPFSDAATTIGPVLKDWREKAKQSKEQFIGVQLDRLTTDHSTQMDGGPESTPTTSSQSETHLKPFYHLGFLGRNPDVPTVPGAVSAVVIPYLERARNKGVPAWLEATTPHAVSVYEYFGFRVVEEITIAVGQKTVEGWPEVGGPGVSAWTMIYDNHMATIHDATALTS